MRKGRRAARLAAWLVLAVCACAPDADQLLHESGASDGLGIDERRGQELFGRYCVGCHGIKGNGHGLASAFLDPKPRDFTRGVYKFRSTPGGSLPTDDDLLRTLREGVHGTSMPSWRGLPEQELRALIAYLKSFSPRFERHRPKPSIPLPGAPADLRDPERLPRGKALYMELGCDKCHGAAGRGDGPSSRTLVDSEGNAIVPFDFTRRMPKGGARPEDLYRTFMTGLAGTPMPDFSELTRDDAQRWDLVAFVLSLREERR